MESNSSGVDITKIPLEQLKQMQAQMQQQAQSQAQPNAPVNPAIAANNLAMGLPARPLQAPAKAPDIQDIPLDQLKQMRGEQAHIEANTDWTSKVLAATGGMVRGALKGIGETAEAVPNIASAAVGDALKGLSGLGIVPDSVAQGYESGRQKVKNLAESVGNKILDFQSAPSAEVRELNPKTAEIAETAGEIAGSTVGAGPVTKLLGVTKYAHGLNPVAKGLLEGGTQGAVMAAGSNDNPVAAGLGGAVAGGFLGSVGGKIQKSAQIIEDKVSDIIKGGGKPYSEEGLKAIQQSLKNNGADLSREVIQTQAKAAVQKELDKAAPKVDITQNPLDMVVNLAKERLPEVKKTKDALYAPLNDSKAVADVSNTTQALNQLTNKTAIKALPDNLSGLPEKTALLKGRQGSVASGGNTDTSQIAKSAINAPNAVINDVAQNAPKSNTLSDLMTYRKQVSGAIDQQEQAIKKGGSKGDYQALQQLYKVKDAVTSDLNTTAKQAGLEGQLQKADAYHANEYLPFKVYNKDGKLASTKDTAGAWDKVSRILRPGGTGKLGKLNDIATTLGPQGKQILGYAYVQHAINKSMHLDGRLDPTKLNNLLDRFHNTGLANKILTPELQETFQGIRRIAKGAEKSLPLNTENEKATAVGKLLNSLMSSTPGIMTLRTIGATLNDHTKNHAVQHTILHLLNTVATKATGAQSGSSVDAFSGETK